MRFGRFIIIRSGLLSSGRDCGVALGDQFPNCAHLSLLVMLACHYASATPRRRMKHRTCRQPSRVLDAVVRPIIRAFVARRKDSKTYPYNDTLLTPLNHQLASPFPTTPPKHSINTLQNGSKRDSGFTQNGYSQRRESTGLCGWFGSP